MKEAKSNPFCPVPGCKTNAPHENDAIVQDLLKVSSGDLASWALAGMTELAKSMSRDVAEKQYFAWLTRLRQPEELYVRTLYLLLLADDNEAAHILSDEWPNGFTNLYNKVNESIFGGRGILNKKQAGLNGGEFTAMETINFGAHVSIKAMYTTIGLHKKPEHTPNADGYFKHILTYCDRLDAMRQRFQAGSTCEEVLDLIRALHLPATLL